MSTYMDTRSLAAQSHYTSNTTEQLGISLKSPPAQFLNIPTHLDVGLRFCFCNCSLFQAFLFNH